MDMMGIASTSMEMHTNSLQMSVGVSVAKKAMDVQETVAQGLLQMLPSDPNVGNYIDIKV